MADPKERSTLEEIALQLPGYSGYVRREARRDADRSARASLVESLKKAKDTVGRAKTKAAQKGDLSALAPLETLTDRLSRLVSKIGNADSGYTGFFDSGSVAEGTLESLCQLDLALIEEAKGIAEAAAGADPEALTGRLDGFEQEFDRRRSILKGA